DLNRIEESPGRPRQTQRPPGALSAGGGRRVHLGGEREERDWKMKLPNAERAFLEMAKLRNYSLSPLHKEGRHKARVFASALGLGISDAEWLAKRLNQAAREQDCQLGKRTPHGQR